MDYPIIDLTNCDIEPIHILGKVQSHGFLIAFDKLESNVLFASNNIETYTGIAAAHLLDQPVTELFKHFDSQDNGNTLLDIIRFGINNEFENLNPLRISIRQITYNLICHLSAHLVVLEFEPSSPDADMHLQTLIGSSLSKIMNGKNLHQTVAAAAQQVKELIRYDRVMIYQFWEDGHGEVIAEEKNEDLEPFFGLHYPASDIPKQARELYKLNLTRIITDVNSTPADIITHATGIEQTIDLTHSTLRAVSNIHIEYLKNMGVMASFSVSIMHKGELWGLIACHNYTPKFIDYKTREHTKLIGQVLSSSFEYKAEQDQKQESFGYLKMSSELVRGVHKNWDLLGALTNHSLLKITSASGAAVVFEGKLHKEGQTPSDEQIMELVTWLSHHEKPLIYHTNSLSKYFLPASAYVKVGSGLLALAISKELGEYIFFFKPEIITTVKWAGNPEKPVETDALGHMKLSPRRSFAVWSQQVEGTSQKWTQAEMNTVVKFREDIVHFVNLKSNEIRKLNEKLQEAYDELDAFSFTISHDLKTPLASVKNYAELLLEDGTDLSESAKRYIGRIIKSGEKMENLIQEVLGYSRVSRQRFIKEKIDLLPVLEEIKAEVFSAFKVPDLQLVLKNILPVMGDKGMIEQVFTNVISNAVKYSSRATNPIITIDAAETDADVIYVIQDNGIGIDTNYGGQIFELFKRMDNSKDFTGSGVGLAIVKRIMTKHGGRIWYESGSDGTIFYLSFVKK